ncbi:MAG: flagella basal body P-ring formation protein FlgA [Acidocella sp. 20-61-6]|nr:MAG: flagella basal body P-ring formation protein FlgA [Acidocella sp. 20-61-6]
MRIIWASLVGLLLASTPAHATPQDPNAVASAIRQALASTGNSTITLGPVEGAEFMQSCAETLTVSVTGLAPFEQAAVHCSSPVWTLYVAVTVSEYATIAVTARVIAAGQTLLPADIQMQSEPVLSYAGRQIFYTAEALTGATAMMNLPAGTILTTGNIAQPVIVHAGQAVAVNIISGNVQVSLTAIATQAGRVGDTILLTNPSTGKHFPALVTPSGPVVNLAF